MSRVLSAWMLASFLPLYAQNENTDLEAGAIAPVDAWTTEGGCPARTGVSASAPLTGDLATVWQADVKGEIEGEPLVFGDHVVVAVRIQERERELRVLRLYDGKTLDSRIMKNSTVPLAPVIDGGWIYVRTSETKLEAFALPGRKAGDRLQSKGTHDAKAPLAPPIAIDGEVYTATPDALVKLNFRAGKKITWSVDCAGVQTIALRGDHLFVVKNRNGRELATHSRVDGARRSNAALSQSPGQATHPPELMVGERFVVIRDPAAFASTSRSFPVACVPRQGARLGDPILLDFLAMPAELDHELLALAVGSQGVRELQHFLVADRKLLVLSNETDRPELFAPVVPPTITRGVAYLGSFAFDVVSHRVLLDSPTRATKRAIPARETLLLVDSSHSLVALRRKYALPAKPLLAIANQGEVQVIRRDGSILPANATFDPDAGTLINAKDKRKPKVCELAEVLAILTKDQRMVFAADVPSATRAVELLLQNEPLEAHANALWQTYEQLDATVPTPARLSFLRAVLRANPVHPEASATVRKMLPEGIVVGEPFEALEWLDFVQAAALDAVKIVPPKFSEGDDELTVAQRLLGFTRSFWRPDLQAVESPRLLVITPLQSPGRLARCLSLGEMVCSTLDDVFKDGTHRRDSTFALQLHLFESKEDYIKQASKRGIDPESMEWTAGHYDARAAVSRIYLPRDDVEFESVVETYAHELTHHWVEQRCPLFRNDELRRSPIQPGYWIVEGFASLVEDFRFDLVHRTVERLNRDSDRIDTVANANAKQLWPWGDLLGLSHAQFIEMKPKAATKITTRLTLGAYRMVDAREMFYAQSAVFTEYLFHANNGRRRDALLQYLALYYTGKVTADDVTKLFGDTPDALGQAAVEWAKEVNRR